MIGELVPERVMELLLDLVCVVDREGNYLYVNAAAADILGYAPQELIGRNMLEFMHPDDHSRTLETVSRIMDGDPQQAFENRYLHKDGRVVELRWSARWSEQDGCRIAVAHDVTAEKRVQRMRSALYEIAEAAHRAESLGSLYRQIHQTIGKLLPVDSFFVALYDDVGQQVDVEYAVGGEPQALPVLDVVQSGEAMLLSTGSDGPGHSNWLGAPLNTHRGVVGALIVQNGSSHYTEEDRELLHFVSTQIATAIEHKRAEERLRHMAGHDALTDLPNRSLFHDRLDMSIKRARRDRERVGLLYLDLNGFKEVNDTFGHQFGDEVLREVARRLEGTVRESDTVARIGGDEFTILLNNIRGQDSINLVAGKARAAISEPIELDGRVLTLAVSIGSAIYPDDGKVKEQLFRIADTAMYMAKAETG